METYETQIMIMKSNFSRKSVFTFIIFQLSLNLFDPPLLGQRIGGGLSFDV
jgi:hypothetical protein